MINLGLMSLKGIVNCVIHALLNKNFICPMFAVIRKSFISCFVRSDNFYINLKW